MNEDLVPDECEVLYGSLDIKPGACPNVVNPKARGVVTVVLAGDEGMDATAVDLTTLRLGRADGVGEAVTPMLRPPGPGVHVADFASPSGEPCECAVDAPDGIDDLVLKFDVEELAAALELGSLSAGSTVTLTLSGALLDGTPFEASDCIVLTGSGARPATLGLIGPLENEANAPAEP